MPLEGLQESLACRRRGSVAQLLEELQPAFRGRELEQRAGLLAGDPRLHQPAQRIELVRVLTPCIACIAWLLVRLERAEQATEARQSLAGRASGRKLHLHRLVARLPGHRARAAHGLEGLTALLKAALAQGLGQKLHVFRRLGSLHPADVLLIELQVLDRLAGQRSQLLQRLGRQPVVRLLHGDLPDAAADLAGLESRATLLDQRVVGRASGVLKLRGASRVAQVLNALKKGQAVGQRAGFDPLGDFRQLAHPVRGRAARCAVEDPGQALET